MTKFKLKLWLALTLLGLLGVASLLLSDLPLDKLPEEAMKLIDPETLRLLILINPALILIITTITGTLLFDKVKLGVPVFEKLLGGNSTTNFSIRGILFQGTLFGIISGVIIVGIAALFDPYLPKELIGASSSRDLHLATKLLYGGVTEELMMRFGLMTFFAWVIIKITKKFDSLVYISAIILAAFVFALGHLPLVFQLVDEPSIPVYAYIILGNGTGGLIFGYAYWKKGLECAMVAHAVAHLTMIGLNNLINI